VIDKGLQHVACSFARRLDLLVGLLFFSSSFSRYRQSSYGPASSYLGSEVHRVF
jgi:hypothetical protein